ncbi:MAG: DUF4160 domain-containing protein [Sediminibacterium sp.]
MPKIFEYLSYIIRFYSNDHLPIHVHVQIDERETKAELLFLEKEIKLVFKKVKGKEPLTLAEAREIAVFLKKYAGEIIEKWNKVFILNQQVDCEKIKVKLKRKKN